MIRILFALALVAGFSTHAWADPACDSQFLDGRPPILTRPDPSAQELCNDGFVDLYAPSRRTVVYAAEHVTPQSLAAGVNLDRANSFHADRRVSSAASAHPADYAGGDYDRGHMAPDHDMPTDEAKRQSDSLANVVPQDPASNRGLWAQIEKTARRQVVLAAEGYIVTGPIYDGALKMMAGRVPVPTRLFKAFYRPAGGVETKSFVGVWVVHNAADGQLQVWTLDQLKAATGIDAFPSLSAADHARADLPPVAAK